MAKQNAPRDRRRMAKILKAQFPFPFDIDPFIDRALREFPENPGAYTYALVIKSKAFRKWAPGIFRPDGTLRMTPIEYQQRREEFRSIAAAHGFKIDRRQIGHLVARNRDPKEFELLARGVQLARQYPGFKEYLNQHIALANNRRRAAAAAGGGEAKHITPIRDQRDLVNFMTKRSDRELYAIYEGAQFQQSAQDAGLDLTAGRARQLAGGTPGIAQPEQIEQSFARIAHQLRQAGDELKSFRVSQRDLEILEFGGPGRAQIAERAEQALKQREAELETRLVQRAVQLNPTGRPVLRQAPQEASL